MDSEPVPSVIFDAMQHESIALPRHPRILRKLPASPEKMQHAIRFNSFLARPLWMRANRSGDNALVRLAACYMFHTPEFNIHNLRLCQATSKLNLKRTEAKSGRISVKSKTCYQGRWHVKVSTTPGYTNTNTTQYSWHSLLTFVAPLRLGVSCTSAKPKESAANPTSSGRSCSGSSGAKYATRRRPQRPERSQHSQGHAYII